MKKYKGIEIIGNGYFHKFISGRFYLIKSIYFDYDGITQYTLSEKPGTTNQFPYEERIEGSLGTTNNVLREAEGCVEVFVKDDEIEIKPISHQELVEKNKPKLREGAVNFYFEFINNGNNKLRAISMVMKYFKISLREAKEFVESEKTPEKVVFLPTKEYELFEEEMQQINCIVRKIEY